MKRMDHMQIKEEVLEKMLNGGDIMDIFYQLNDDGRKQIIKKGKKYLRVGTPLYKIGISIDMIGKALGYRLIINNSGYHYKKKEVKDETAS